MATKVSFASKDAYVPSIGITEGRIAIVDAHVAVFQYPPNKETGDQFDPFLAAILSLNRIDEKGEAQDEEPSQKVLRIEKDLTKMRPGQATSREDTEPEDLGDELDTVGNCIITESGAKINSQAAYSVFVRSLEEAGFKSDIMGAGYFPDLIGLQGHAKTVKGEKRNIQGREVEPAYFVIDKISVFPYEKAAKKPVAKSATKTASKANGVPAPNGIHTAAEPVVTKPTPTTSTSSASSSDAADAAATGLLAELATELSGETREAKKLFAMAFSRMMKDKDRDRKLDKPVGDLFKDEDWLTTKAVEIGFSYTDGVFAFDTALTAA